MYLVSFIIMSGSPCLYLDVEGRDFSFSLIVTTETYNTLRSSVGFFCVFFFSLRMEAQWKSTKCVWGFLPLVWGEPIPGRGHDVFFVCMYVTFCILVCVVASAISCGCSNSSQFLAYLWFWLIQCWPGVKTYYGELCQLEHQGSQSNYQT